MHAEKKVALIILNWNGKENTLECLRSVAKLVRKNINLEIYVVDNASSDGSVEEIKRKFPYVHTIQNKQNKGFTGGNNVAIRQALKHNADFVWLLNNDTIVEKRALVELADVFDDPSVGIAASKIYFMKGYEFHHDRYKEHERGKVLWYAGGIIDWNNVYGFHRGVDEVDHGQHENIVETDYATGCSMMIARKCIDCVGVFDERYFAYLEDMDLSLRVKQYGWKVLYVPASIVWHKNAGSTARPGNEFHQYYLTRNRLLFGLTYAPLRTKLALIKESLRFMFLGTIGQKQAIFDMLLKRFGRQYLWKR
jgi:GT2 family glycosyltransferase